MVVSYVFREMMSMCTEVAGTANFVAAKRFFFDVIFFHAFEQPKSMLFSGIA
jgi:hypothetical protein